MPGSGETRLWVGPPTAQLLQGEAGRQQVFLAESSALTGTQRQNITYSWQAHRPNA